MKIFDDKDLNVGFEYPDHWEIEKNEDVLSIYDSMNGVGALQISCYKTPNHETFSTEKKLREYLQDRYRKINILNTHDYSYTDYLIDDNNRCWKYWLIFKNGLVVFCTYNWLKEDISKEEDVINKIISSVVLDFSKEVE